MDYESPLGDGPFPSFCLLELAAFDTSIGYAFMCNGKRFYVDVEADKLQGEGTLLDDFNHFKDDIDDAETTDQFEDWVLESLDSFIQRHAPVPNPETLNSTTLLDYFTPETFAFELVNEQGKLTPIPQNYDPRRHGDSSPRTQIVDSPPRLDISRNSAVVRSTLPQVPIFRASQLERVIDGLGEEEMSDIPKKVRLIGSDTVFFFKAGFKDHGHLREIELLSQISQRARFEPPFRTSKLTGLVVWDDDNNSLMGFLLDYIEGRTLQSCMDHASPESKKKWMDQIEATLKQVHEIGIVWGDVKPDNIIVNEDGDAVLIDFGGGYTPEYISSELQQTAQGDLMGLDHMRAVMGVSHNG